MAHRWRFFRAGALDQVRLETGADIAALAELDPKLWVALACPVSGLELDEATLALVDGDGDGRVRLPEVLAAIAFCRDGLRDLGSLLQGSSELPFAAVRDDTETGRLVLKSARRVLQALDKPDAAAISLADLADTPRIFAHTRLNGDGVITPRSTEDADLAQVVTDAVATVGGAVDRSGAPGVKADEIARFFDELVAFEAWSARAVEPDVVPLGEGTASATIALLGVRAKIDDYFTRCNLAEFRGGSEDRLNPTDDDLGALAGRALSADATEAATLPLSRIEAGRPLDLESGINPAFTAAMAAFVRDVVVPVLGPGRAVLRESEWARIKDVLTPHLAWSTGKPVTKADELGVDRVRAILGSDAKQRLADLIAADEGYAEDFDAIAVVSKLVRYHRDLYQLLRNFVSFVDFYAPGQSAVFQAGTLYLDSRSVEMCVRVIDPARHAAMAVLSKCYIAYCACTRKDGSAMQIAAIFTAGDSDYLMVGRNGVFWDRQGRDWDATITKIVENPISLREAFFAPYKKAIRMVEEQVTKRAAAEPAPLTALVATPGAPAKPPGGFDLSTIALIGVAVSGAAAVIGGLLQAFFGLGIWMPLGILAVVLLISGPSLLITGLKLSQRNLGPVLDANGWAINGRVKVNIPFGASLTKLREFPAGSEHARRDPYEPKSGWIGFGNAVVAPLLLAGATAVSYHQGWIPAAYEHRMSFLGVPRHLVFEKERAQTSVDDAKVVATSAQDQLAAAKGILDGLLADPEAEPARVERAKGRLAQADARQVRAEDRLYDYEIALEVATEALDVAVDGHERAADEATP